MMEERGLGIDHTTLYRWVPSYAPEIEKHLRWHARSEMGWSWRVDETYIKVKGQWVYLYRAVDKRSHTIDFFIPTHNIKAAKKFLGKALKKQKAWGISSSINTDKNPTYATIKGFEVMRIFKKRQMDIWLQGKGVIGEVRLINNQFGIYTS